ncbi:MAG TPA: hypothetical protein VFZ53_23060 [Polyangiaceae bacterium]
MNPTRISTIGPFRVASALLFSTLLAVTACGDDGEGDGDGDNGPNRPEDTGAACEAPSDCYPDVSDGDLRGDAVCITRVRDGYCTHTCEMDTDCCAAEGECDSGLTQVCSPFESMEGLHCFVSCESADVAGAPDAADEQDYCQKKASPDFICRSSGGGSANRKICVPGDCGVGARCSDDADCATDLDCVTGFDGGYCTLRGCSANADCPGDSLCVTSGGDNYCYRPCAGASDCSFCRNSDAPARCSDDVTFAEDGTAGSVCVPG